MWTVLLLLLTVTVRACCPAGRPNHIRTGGNALVIAGRAVAIRARKVRPRQYGQIELRSGICFKERLTHSQESIAIVAVQSIQYH